MKKKSGCSAVVAVPLLHDVIEQEKGQAGNGAAGLALDCQRLPWGIITLYGKEDISLPFNDEDVQYVRLWGQQVVAILGTSGLINKELLSESKMLRFVANSALSNANSS